MDEGKSYNLGDVRVERKVDGVDKKEIDSMVKKSKGKN